ncbi:MAG: hypothetical protein QOE45_2493 [Frankiaceae bacterium]|jgi:hypothetical protein|nr:hypothetical protein [Frankiaceae bacterium]
MSDDGTGKNKGADKGPLGPIYDLAELIIKPLAPNVPKRTAGIILVVVFAMVVIMGVAALLTGVALLAVVAAVVMLAVLGVSGSVRILKGPGSPPKAPADPETLSLAYRLDDSQHDAVCEIVEHAVDDVAGALRTPRAKLRGNVFGCDGHGTLRIMPAYDHNMTHKKERNVSMRIGQGNNGLAWASGGVHVAVRPSEGGSSALPLNQTKRIPADLSWIISAPACTQLSKPTWVLNVDGLDDPRTQRQLGAAIGPVVLWAEQLALVLGAVAPEMAGEQS